ncbi:MAG: hypothetical protein WCP06_06355 [Verrucomicrobiota bacterium]
MRYFRRKSIRTFFWLLIFGIVGAVSSAHAQGLTFFRLGWTYAIAFPNNVQTGVDSGLVPGVGLYRVSSFAGEQWYLLQRIERKPNGWGLVPGAPSVWVNLNYALSVQEVR